MEDEHDFGLSIAKRDYVTIKPDAQLTGFTKKFCASAQEAGAIGWVIDMYMESETYQVKVLACFPSRVHDRAWFNVEQLDPFDISTLYEPVKTRRWFNLSLWK